MGNQAKAYAAYLADYAKQNPTPSSTPTTANYFTPEGGRIAALLGKSDQCARGKFWSDAKVFFCETGEVVEESRTTGGAPIYAMFASREDWNRYHTPKPEFAMFEQW